MSSGSAVRAFASSHGVTWKLAVAAVVAFGLLGPVSSYHLPLIDPDPRVVDRPLEQMGTLLLTGLTFFGAVALPDRARWLSATSPRRFKLWRATWAGVVLLTTSALCAASSVFLPQAISRWHVLGLWAFCMGVVLVLSSVVPAVLAPLVPLTFAALATFGAIPFAVNLCFNPGLRSELWLSAAAANLCGILLHGLAGERSSRHEMDRPV